MQPHPIRHDGATLEQVEVSLLAAGIAHVRRKVSGILRGEIAMESGAYASVALVHFLFAIFCAYWAQTTGRNAWLWFFLGFFFAPITGLVLLYENSKQIT